MGKPKPATSGDRDIYVVSITRAQYDWLCQRGKKKRKDPSAVARVAINRYRKSVLRRRGKKVEAVKEELDKHACRIVPQRSAGESG